MRTAPPVWVVVLNWHGRADTLQCLQALAETSYPDLSVVLIDNDCAEFSADELQRLVPRGRYLRTAANLGFAGGSNLGMRAALEAGAELIWFLNNDAQPEAAALTELVATMTRDETIGIVGPKILQQQDPRRIDSIALDIALGSGRMHLIGHDEIDQGQYDDRVRAIAVTACAMLVRRVVCERLGGFADDFFAYLEDADLCLRARAAGWQIAVAPCARVFHRRAAATQGRQSLLSLYYTTRNHLRLLDRHAPAPGWHGRLRRLAVIALNLAYAMRAGGPPLAARVRAVWRGVADYRRGVAGATWQEP